MSFDGAACSECALGKFGADCGDESCSWDTTCHGAGCSDGTWACTFMMNYQDQSVINVVVATLVPPASVSTMLQKPVTRGGGALCLVRVSAVKTGRAQRAINVSRTDMELIVRHSVTGNQTAH